MLPSFVINADFNFLKNVFNQDLFFQCLVEAIYILDTLCSTDKSLVPKLIEIIRRMYARVTSDSKWKRVLISLVQFFLNHGEYTVEHWLLLQILLFCQFIWFGAKRFLACSQRKSSTLAKVNSSL